MLNGYYRWFIHSLPFHLPFLLLPSTHFPFLYLFLSFEFQWNSWSRFHIFILYCITFLLNILFLSNFYFSLLSRTYRMASSASTLSCFRETIYEKIGSMKKCDHDMMHLSWPFPEYATVAVRNLFIADGLRLFKGKITLDAARPKLLEWLGGSITAPFDDFFRHENFSAEAAEDIDCLNTLRNWCHALGQPCHGDMAACRVLIRESTALEHHGGDVISLSESVLDNTDTPTKVALALHLRTGVDCQNPLALFESLVGKDVSTADWEAIQQSLLTAQESQQEVLVDSNPFSALYLRALSHCERIILFMRVSGKSHAESASLARPQLLSALQQKSKTDLLEDSSALWSFTDDIWRGHPSSIPLTAVESHRIERGWLILVPDGNLTDSRGYYYQVTLVTGDESSFLLTLSNLSGGEHFGLPQSCVLNTDEVPTMWVYDPSNTEAGELMTDGLVNNFAVTPELLIKYPGSLIKKRDVSALSSSESSETNAHALGNGRQTFSSGPSSLPIGLTARRTENSSHFDFTTSRSATMSKSQAYAAGQSSRTLLGNPQYLQVCNTGTFTSVSVLTMVQSATMQLVKMLPILNNVKQLKSFLLWNVVLIVAENVDGFHIQQCLLSPSIAISSAYQLSNAIEKFALIWDLLRDKTGQTSFMRDVMSVWLSRLIVGISKSVASLPAPVLTMKFMGGLLNIAGLLRAAGTDTLSRLELKAALTEAMAFDVGELVAESMASNYSGKATFPKPLAVGRSNKSASGANRVHASQSTPRPAWKANSPHAGSSAAAPASNTPCYAHMMHSWGGSLKPCKTPNCTRDHNLSHFSKPALIEHAKNRKGAHGEAVRTHIGNN
jgi:hypothetical protein